MLNELQKAQVTTRKPPYRTRNEHLEAEESLGNCAGTGEADSNASRYDVHVRQLIADILDHDGLHAVRVLYNQTRA